MCLQHSAGAHEGGRRKHAEGRLTNFLSRPGCEQGYELEGGADQNAEGRLANLLSRPCGDSLGQVKLKEPPASVPEVA